LLSNEKPVRQQAIGFVAATMGTMRDERGEAAIVAPRLVLE
jgi:hypothetical protein